MKSTTKLKERIKKLRDVNYILKLQLKEEKTRNRQLNRINKERP